jgi:hypothetical protein
MLTQINFAHGECIYLNVNIDSRRYYAEISREAGLFLHLDRNFVFTRRTTMHGALAWITHNLVPYMRLLACRRTALPAITQGTRIEKTSGRHDHPAPLQTGNNRPRTHALPEAPDARV